MERVMSLLHDAEAGQRGYLLTGSELYLRPYDAAVLELPKALASFQASSKAAGFELTVADRLHREALEKMDELATTIRLYRLNGRAAAMEVVNTNRGNALMAQARRDARALREADFAAILQDLGGLESGNRYALAVSISGNVAAIVLLILVSVRLNRAFARNDHLLSQLSTSEQRYRLLVQRCELVREEERASLAREIHDALGGALTSIKFGLMAARNNAQEHGALKAVARLHEESADIDRTIRSLRRIASALRPPLLDQVGLVAALEAYTNEFAERTGIQVEQQFPAVAVKLPPDQGIGLYRIVQEALTNVARHAHASRVEVWLAADGDKVQLSIRDNGVGFAMGEATQKKSLGLLGMQERADLAGAQLIIESAPQKGTRVSAVITPRSGQLADSADRSSDRLLPHH
jgi:signal transduction histidine kinase